MQYQNHKQLYTVESNNCDYKEALQDMALFFAQKAAGSLQFKSFVYEQCYKQEYGDYYVRVEELKDLMFEHGLIDESEKNNLEEILERYNCSAENAAVLFIPHLEEVSANYFTMPQATCPQGAPIITFGYTYDVNTATTTKYTLNYNELLPHPEEPITEEFAWNWENDVWVFNVEEVCSADNMVKAPGDTLTVFNDDLPTLEPFVERVDGKKEWGGMIQVTNLNNIESWINGKVEFKYFVNSSNGTLLKEVPFGKWKRKNFKHQRWHNFNDLIGFWNLSVWGPMQLERWIEEDGGSSTINIQQSINAGSGWPTITINHSIQNRDQNLGSANVQFTDPSLPDLNYTVYNLYSLNFARVSEQ
jgi:hypothetical protein